MSFITKISNLFIDPNKKEVGKLKSLVDKVNSLEEEYQKLSDADIKNKTLSFKERYQKGESLNSLLPEAFANCREAAKRTIGQRAFDTQLMGGIVLHQGKIAEMKTGEGKTLSSTFPAYLNALSQKGVHIITVNDYLARRDTNWMGSIFNFLGLEVGCIQHDTAYLFDPQVAPDENETSIEYENLRPVSRGEAYKADITYGTNNEFGFDYLRDNMVPDISRMVQVRDPRALVAEEKEKIKKRAKGNEEILKKRYLNFAIVDEVDSILIDEARTPLIISAPDTESAKLYQRAAQVVPKLIPDKDYNVDEKMQAATLSESGIEKLEKMLGIENLYAPGQMQYVHHIHQALKAHAIFKKDKQYVVKDGEVMIVDDFTGRLMPGRRFSEGLHQALEAKEGLKVQKESRTLATITFQNYFRLYNRLSGMTGTALTSAEEFAKVYSLDVVEIPTHRPMVREDLPDQIFKNEKGKFEAIAKEIKTRNQKGQPVLVGTISVEKSEAFSQYLDREGVKYEILNAKNHEREAQIVSAAGEKSAVTIATNMAGRGTDIKLGEGVKEAGGLHIIGTERHEARRIDNQLRDRAGRQGDPGSSQFYVSLEDELMRRFGSDKIKGMMDTLGLPEEQPIQNPMISRSIESAQKKIEGFNFDTRKHVLEYDDVINRQREAIYEKRRQILLGIVEEKEVARMIKQLIEDVVHFHCAAEDQDKWNIQEIFEYSASLFNAPQEFKETLEGIIKDSQLDLPAKKEKLSKTITELALNTYQEKMAMLPEGSKKEIERVVMLRTLDNLWMDHLDNMQFLREGIGLRGYGQRDPLVEYKKEGFDMFQNLLSTLRLQTVETLFKIQIQPQTNTPPVVLAGQNGINQNNLKLQGADSNQSTLAQSKTRNAPAAKEEKVGRNDPCPCGSGKKYKKCCGKKDN